MSDWFDRMRNVEPARVRAVWTAVVALAVALGVTVNTDLDTSVQALIVAVFTLLPLLQGEATRKKVTPVFKVAEDAILADIEAEADRLAAEPVTPDESDMFDVGGE